MASEHSAPPNPIEVLHLVHWPRSGITSLLRNLVAFSDRASFRHHIAFFLGEPEELRWFGDHGCAAVDLGFTRDRPGALLRLRQAVRRREGGLIHSHSFQPGVWGRVFHRTGRTGYVSSVHSPYPYFLERSPADRVKSRLEQFSINRAGHPVVAVSEAVRQHLLTRTRIDPGRIRLIRNGIDTRLTVTPGAVDPGVRQAIGLGPEDRYAIAVARLSPEKGLDVLLRAWPLVMEKQRGFKLVIVGDGAESAPLKALAAELGLAGSVTFAGFQDNVPVWLSGATICINPSRFEGLPMGILEAQLAQVPLIATAVGGVPEVITDGGSGILVPSENPAAIAAAVEQILNDPDQARAMAANGYRQVLAGYDIRRTVGDYENLYREILAGLARGRKPGRQTP